MKHHPPKPGQMSMSERGRLGGRTNAAKRRKAAEKLEELGVDPIELSVNFALGIGQKEPHPVAEVLRVRLDFLRRKLDEGLPVVEQDIDDIEVVVEEHLDSGYVPPVLQSKHIIDLMQYQYPKLRAVEVSGEVTNYHNVDDVPDHVLFGLLQGSVDPASVTDLFDDDSNGPTSGSTH